MAATGGGGTHKINIGEIGSYIDRLNEKASSIDNEFTKFSGKISSLSSNSLVEGKITTSLNNAYKQMKTKQTKLEEAIKEYAKYLRDEVVKANEEADAQASSDMDSVLSEYGLN